MKITQEDIDFCLSKGYNLVDNGDGTAQLLPTEDKKAEVIAKNKAIEKFIESDANLKALGLK